MRQRFITKYILLSLYQNFYKTFPFLETESLIEYFAFYGGTQDKLELNFFEDIEISMDNQFVQNLSETEKVISPNYLLESPYKEMLTAIARGDGKIHNVLNRARIGDGLGKDLIGDLVELDILSIEESRESPLRAHPKQAIKKHLRSYRIQPKIRFVKPFYRFWFGFVEPYRKDLESHMGDRFIENFHQHKDRAISLVFEQLSNLLLERYICTKDPLISKGGFWDRHSEFDILSVTKSRKVILGECKYTSRKVCKNELTKLREKAVQSGIKVDYFALFSRSGFSNELMTAKPKDVLLFGLDDFKMLLDN